MQLIHEFSSPASALHPLARGWVGVESVDGGLSVISISKKRNDAAALTFAEAAGAAAAPRPTPSGGDDGFAPTANGAFVLSRSGAVTFHSANEELAAVNVPVPRGVTGIAANDTTLIVWHAGGFHAYSIASETIAGPDDIRLLGAVAVADADDSLQAAALGPSRAGTSNFVALLRMASGNFAVMTICASSSGFSQVGKCVIPLASASSLDVTAFSVDAASFTHALVVFDDGTLVVVRESKITFRAHLTAQGGSASPAQLADVTLCTPTHAVAAKVVGGAGGSARIALMTLELTQSRFGKTVRPAPLGPAFEAAAPSPVVVMCALPGTDDVVVACGTAIYRAPSTPGAPAGSLATSGGDADTQGAATLRNAPKPNSVAAAMMAAVAGASAAATSSTATKVVDWLLTRDFATTAPPVVARDDLFTTSPDGSHHQVLDAVVAKSPGASGVAKIVRYLAVAEGLAFSTVFTALRIVATQTSGARIEGLGDAEPVQSQTQLRTPEAALKQLCPVVTSIADAIQMKSIHGFAAAGASPKFLPADVSGAVLEALYCVLLHTLQCGAFALSHAVVQLIDGVVIAHAPVLCAQFPFALRRAVTVIQQVGRWSMTDAGLRLGQITAHCGPTADNKKEAAVVPHVPYRIVTTKPVHIKREEVRLAKKPLMQRSQF